MLRGFVGVIQVANYGWLYGGQPQILVLHHTDEAQLG